MKLLILLFLAGIIPLVQPVIRKFYLIQQSKRWAEAQTYCRTKHTDLVTIETPADMIQLQAVAQKHQFTSSAWIGLYKVLTEWRWSFNNEILGSWTLWNPGEPTNLNEDCVVIANSNWSDVECTAERCYMCYDAKLTGNDSYIYYSYPYKSWFAAQNICRQHHTDIVTISNPAEHSIVMGKNQWTYLDLWIGLYRNKKWLWSDQSNVSTIAWAPGQPDSTEGNVCGYVQNGLISDTRCSNYNPFFCYSVITGQQQMVRMKFQSDQDLNDPAVQAVILQQIQQNLKHHGIANMTVKFRKQPGGAVFHKLEENQTAVENKSREACEL